MIVWMMCQRLLGSAVYALSRGAGVDLCTRDGSRQERLGDGGGLQVTSGLQGPADGHDGQARDSGSSQQLRLRQRRVKFVSSERGYVPKGLQNSKRLIGPNLSSRQATAARRAASVPPPASACRSVGSRGPAARFEMRGAVSSTAFRLKLSSRLDETDWQGSRPVRVSASALCL